MIKHHEREMNLARSTREEKMNKDVPAKAETIDLLINDPEIIAAEMRIRKSKQESVAAEAAVMKRETLRKGTAEKEKKSLEIVEKELNQEPGKPVELIIETQLDLAEKVKTKHSELNEAKEEALLARETMKIRTIEGEILVVKKNRMSKMMEQW